MLFGQDGGGRVSCIGLLLSGLMAFAGLPSRAASQSAATNRTEGGPAQPGAAAPATAPGASFYAAIGGRHENDGSSAKPWPSVEFALSRVGAGNTVMVKPGSYRATWQIRNHPAKSGGPPTIVKSEVKWKAVVHGGPGEVLSCSRDTKNVTGDYNLCRPEAANQGTHSTSADPRFVKPGYGVFWLRPDSPAIGKGSPEYAPATDFWGRPSPRGKAPDLGAFAFEPLLAAEKARIGWYGWPYRFAPQGEMELSDPWVLPRERSSP